MCNETYKYQTLESGVGKVRREEVDGVNSLTPLKIKCTILTVEEVWYLLISRVDGGNIYHY